MGRRRRVKGDAKCIVWQTKERRGDVKGLCLPLEGRVGRINKKAAIPFPWFYPLKN